MIDECVEKLRHMKVAENSDWMIYFVFRYLKDDSFAEPYFALCKISDLKTRGVKADNYSVEYVWQKESVGYWVADTPLTNYYLNELVQDYLWDASWHGIDQEDLPKWQKEIEKAIQETKEDKNVKSFTSFEEMEKELGLPQEPSLTLKEKKFQEKAEEIEIQVSNEFSELSERIEINKILKSFTKVK